MPIFVEVLLDQNFSRPLDYIAPDHAQVGMRVEVPLKSTLKKGTIAKIKKESSFKTCKPIHKILSQHPELSDKQLQLAHWMASYYVAPLQRVFKCFLPSNVRNPPTEKTRLFVSLGVSKTSALELLTKLRTKSPKQAECLEELLKIPKGQFAHLLKASKPAIEALRKKGILKTVQSAWIDETFLEEEFFKSQPKTLNEEQSACLTQIAQDIEKKHFCTHLIHGVTGSGKTEIYLQAIRKTLDQGQTAIMLVPEISLTSQTIERFKARFSEKLVVLHHQRTLKERSEAWKELKSGEAKLLIGARSALFAPIQNLGLIIVDEEHDSSYKQSDEIPCYHGRDVAIMRGFFESCPVLLGSATPSIESRYNASIQKYHYHVLSQRATKASMPEVELIDMSLEYERRGGFTHFSDTLLTKLKERMEKGEQALLFLNRRGYHRMQVCPHCQYVVKCPHCDLSLTFHKTHQKLACHLCGHQKPIVRVCPNCQSQEGLNFKGFGTEHVEKSLHAIFPEIRTLRMDRDTTSKKDQHEEIFKQFRASKADVLIGTQMIAKGFHFPNVTLVGILNPDGGLHIPDFRAPEQMFQLLTQVAGRAGRAELLGEVLIQTHLKEHPLLKWAKTQDYENFYKIEIEERKQFGYPPFCRLVKVLFTHTKEEEAKLQAESAHLFLKESLPPQAELLPVMPCGHAKIKDRYRYQFLLKTTSLKALAPLLQKLEFGKIDVDPISTFF